MRTLHVLEHRVICKDERYNSFPSILRKIDGSLLLTFRRAPDWRKRFGVVTHIDPASYAAKMTSMDGYHWDTPPSVLYDDFFSGVQDPRLHQLKDGTLLCTFFLWKVAEKDDSLPKTYTNDVMKHWKGSLVGTFSIRSTDGGDTWDEPAPFPGPPLAMQGDCVELEDGAIVAPTYRDAHLFLYKSFDRGLTWVEHAKVERTPGYYFCEPNLYRAPSGKLVLWIRSAKLQEEGKPELPESPLLTAESVDGGQTWSEPVLRPYNSPSPFHVLSLGEDGVLVTYGQRYAPQGICCILLDAECSNWDEAKEYVIRDDGKEWDLGYPSAARLPDGNVLLVYYFVDEKQGPRYIAGTVCKIE